MTNGRLLHVNVSPGGVPKLPVRGQGHAPGSGGRPPARRHGAWRSASCRLDPRHRGDQARRGGGTIDCAGDGERTSRPRASTSRSCRSGRARRRGRGRPGAGFRGRSVPDDPALVPRPSVQPSRASDASRRQPDVRPGGPGGNRPAGRRDRRGRARRRRRRRLVVASRLDRAVRSACLSLWRAAADGGAPIAILDDEPAAAACAALPSRTFNQAVGFAHLPNLSGLAVRHWSARPSAGSGRTMSRGRGARRRRRGPRGRPPSDLVTAAAHRASSSASCRGPRWGRGPRS